MDLKQIMANDIKSVFYSINDFAISASYQSQTIPALHVEDYEISDTREQVISCRVDDVSGLSIGDTIVIDNTNYEVINFDFKDKYEIEYIIVLNKA